MNIYFVSRKSRIKGPSEITDSSRRRVISVGDFCVRECEHGIEILWVVQDNMSSWKACSRVAFTSTPIECKANTLLFAYDGASLRHGNLAILQKLILVFEGKARDFFQNAVSILTYQDDCWDAQIFQSFHESARILKESLSNNVQAHVEEPFMHLLFLNYFEEPLKRDFYDLISQGLEVKQSYATLRANHGKDFYKALENFLKDNPTRTIYDVTRQKM